MLSHGIAFLAMVVCLPANGTQTSDHRPEPWSPDGTRIAFVSDRDGNSEIYVVTIDGASLTRLTTDTAEDFSPAWS